jgi:MFS family permease
MTQTDAPSWKAALATTLLIQIASSVLLQAQTVVGPSLTAAAGVAPHEIGTLAALCSFGAVWFLMGGLRLMSDLGPVRVLQLGVVVSAAGLLLGVSAYWPLALLAGLLVGLGYGPAPPAGNQLLMQTAPAAHRALIFSIKQAGAPFGSALAGLALPFVAESYGWRAALFAAAAAAMLSVIAVEPYRARLDRQPSRLTREALIALVSPRMVLAPFQAISVVPILKRLAFAGCMFSFVQGSIFALFITFLVTRLDYDLQSAGFAFAIMQLTGTAARIIVGWIADRLRAHLTVLAAFGLASSANIFLIGLMDRGWSGLAVMAVSAATGFLAASWNGVLLSEIARLSPPARVGETSSAATFFIFLGYVTGPALFALVIHWTGSYPLAFRVLMLLPLMGAAALFLSRPRP